MRARNLIATAAVAAIALAGCGGGDEPTATESPTAGSTEAAASPTPVDLPEGIAAKVDDSEIAVEQVEQRVDALVAQTEEQQSASPSEGATEGVDPEQREAAITAQVLSDLVVGRVILDGADELGVAPTDEDVAELREQVAQGAGGEEAFLEQATAVGYDEAAIERELRILAAFQNITDALVEESGGDAASPAPEDQQAVQEWLVEQLEAASIVVDDQYGVWDPASGQVVPVG